MTRAEAYPDAAAPNPWAPGVVYGLGLLASGWILGPLRVLFVAPWTGPLTAVLLEAPLMIAVMALSLQWMARVGWMAPRPRDRIAVGVIGAGLVLLGEGAGALLIGDSRQSINAFLTPAGLVGLGLVGLAALAPLIQGLGRKPGPKLR